MKAAKRYKRFVLRRRPTRKEVRREIRAQLGFVGRDLETIQKLQDAGAQLSAKNAQLLVTLRILHEQQKFLCDNKTHRVPDGLSASSSRTSGLSCGAR